MIVNCSHLLFVFLSVHSVCPVINFNFLAMNGGGDEKDGQDIKNMYVCVSI